MAHPIVSSEHAKMQGLSAPARLSSPGAWPTRRHLMDEQQTTPALCQCGCGLPAPIASTTCASRGHKKGQPLRFRHGHAGRKPVPYVLEDRGFDSPCWIWQLATDADGYGVGGGHRARRAHLVYYEREYGPVPSGMHVHHRCEQRACVNPAHLEAQTPGAHKQHHSRLTWAIVREIRARSAQGERRNDLAAAYGLSPGGLDHIVKGRRWREEAADGSSNT